MHRTVPDIAKVLDAGLLLGDGEKLFQYSGTR